MSRAAAECPVCHRQRSVRVTADIEFSSDAIASVSEAAIHIHRKGEVERDTISAFFVCSDCGRSDEITRRIEIQ